jgi:hypothetical protein
MKRVAPVLGVVFFGCMAYGLYHLAYEVKRLEDQLITYNRALMREREAIDFLQAEWSYLTRPDRLQASADRHLNLTPAPLHRLLRIEDLPERPEGAIVVGWGEILVPDPSAPPAPLAKPARDPMTVPVVPTIATPAPGHEREQERGPRSVAWNGGLQ